MNALRLSSRCFAAPIRRSFASARPAVPKQPNVPDMYNYSFKKAWVSDSSVYPMIATLGFAGAFVVGMIANALLFYKDVRISNATRKPVIRDWGHEKTRTFTEIMAGDYYHSNPEGLGVDHEAWVKAKAAAEAKK